MTANGTPLPCEGRAFPLHDFIVSPSLIKTTFRFDRQNDVEQRTAEIRGDLNYAGLVFVHNGI